LPTPERFRVLPPPQVLRDAMSRLVGLERSAEGLNEALRIITQIERAGAHEPTLLNMTATAKLVVAGALARRESRGSHFRTDYPQTDLYGVRTFLTLAEAERMIAEPGANAPTRSLA
jgi:L-aspartate oxidase